ncbi:hypothetical protein IHE56_14040 [Streptomyces sp. ID01-12c]|uniref:hypothetical protein n=1 Tax=Streptomyces caniscabiei TaxID=2746961 RepID=UPI001782BB46|nr:hypothetical protein [Streptomyces caniscabiei]MBD9703187.1 hypothetical protein [Streptomyces caniscabiei]MDX3732820.1 hypothetical protein [Streptomyces caniscabiei]
MNVSPETLVTAAGRLLQPAPGAATPLSPALRARAAAVLLRMAIDQALDAYWQRITPSMTRIGKHRMLCLEWYAGHDTARRCRTTWSALSAACHYRTYELPPAPAEIHTRLLEVTALLAALRDRPDPASVTSAGDAG